MVCTQAQYEDVLGITASQKTATSVCSFVEDVGALGVQTAVMQWTVKRLEDQDQRATEIEYGLDTNFLLKSAYQVGIASAREELVTWALFTGALKGIGTPHSFSCVHSIVYSALSSGYLTTLGMLQEQRHLGISQAALASLARDLQVFLMQAGFALYAAGVVRAKNVSMVSRRMRARCSGCFPD